jgi:hypothetical protein
MRGSATSFFHIVLLFPQFQYDLRCTRSRVVVVLHTAIEIVGGDVYQKPALCLATTSGTVTDIWKAHLRPENVFDLQTMSANVDAGFQASPTNSATLADAKSLQFDGHSFRKLVRHIHAYDTIV